MGESKKLSVIITSLMAVTAGLAAGMIFIACVGKNPFVGLYEIFFGALATERRIACTLGCATQLILTGLSFAFAFRCGLFNIGIAGQMIMGGLAASLAAAYLPDFVPRIITILIIVVTAAATGGLWSIVAGFLKARYNVHEVVSTIMMNWVAYWIVYDAVPRFICNPSVLIRSASLPVEKTLSAEWIRELTLYLNGQGEMPEKPVILTIDDGKLGVYKNAFPLLQKYNMKAVLAVIGIEIHTASEAPELRSESPAPYCTWAELAEMSASGHVEIASHSYGLHVYQHDGRIGADCGEPDTMADFQMDAYKDFRTLQDCLKNYDIPSAVTFAYPYSVRSIPADEVWLQCGYQMLLGGNMESVRASRTNYFIQEAGFNAHSSVLRRIARMHGTPIEDYIG